MRITISLDEDLYGAVKSLARADDVSMSGAINALLRRAVFPSNDPLPLPSVRNGLHVIDGRAPLSSEEVRRMEERLDEEYGGAKK